MYSLGSETAPRKSLDSLYSQVAHEEQWRAGVGLLVSFQLSRLILEFIPVDEWGHIHWPLGKENISDYCLGL